MLNFAVKFHGLDNIQDIVLIGAGNVATQLGLAIQKTGRRIVQVYSRKEENARVLSAKLQAGFTDELKMVNQDAGLYIIAVADDAVEKVAGSLHTNRGMVVHTSGSVSMDVLGKCSENYGVLYPLQTFSKAREIDFSVVPLCIEANSKDNLQLLEQMARELSRRVVEVDSERRKILHLAAVFACNFPNFMYDIAGEILSDKSLDFDLLRPLILETAMKVQELNPGEAQTGPASRGDEAILTKHDELLSVYPEFWKIYKILSEGIKGKRGMRL